MSAKIEVIDKAIFINKPEFEVYQRNATVRPDEPVHMFYKTTRGTCVDGVMKNSKCYKVTLDLEYLDHFKKIAASSIMNTSTYIDTAVKDLFPGKQMWIYTPLTYHPIAKLGHDKWMRHATNYSTEWCDIVVFECYCSDDFVELPKTKNESKKIEEERLRQQTEKLNIVFMKNTIDAVLKEAGIKTTDHKDTYKYGNRAYLAIDDKKDWNKLILLAINQYLNGIAKEYGFKIKQPKFHANAKLDCYSPLFFMDDVEVLNETK